MLPKNMMLSATKTANSHFHDAFSFLLSVAMGYPMQEPVNHEIIDDFHLIVMNKCLGQGLHDSGRAAAGDNDIDRFAPARFVFQTAMHHHQRAANGIHHAAGNGVRRCGWERIYFADGAVEVGGFECHRLFHQVETGHDGAPR